MLASLGKALTSHGGLSLTLTRHFLIAGPFQGETHCLLAIDGHFWMRSNCYFSLVAILWGWFRDGCLCRTDEETDVWRSELALPRSHGWSLVKQAFDSSLSKSFLSSNSPHSHPHPRPHLSISSPISLSCRALQMEWNADKQRNKPGMSRSALVEDGRGRVPGSALSQVVWDISMGHLGFPVRTTTEGMPGHK